VLKLLKEWGKWGKKENDGGGENFCKCHNVSPEQQKTRENCLCFVHWLEIMLTLNKERKTEWELHVYYFNFIKDKLKMIQ
jgi:hypothetical protein